MTRYLWISMSIVLVYMSPLVLCSRSSKRTKKYPSPAFLYFIDQSLFWRFFVYFCKQKKKNETHVTLMVSFPLLSSPFSPFSFLVKHIPSTIRFHYFSKCFGASIFYDSVYFYAYALPTSRASLHPELLRLGA